MKTEDKIILHFIEESAPLTIREISKRIRADYRITHFAVQKLIKKGILAAKTVGKSTLCSLNNGYYGMEIYQAEGKRKEDLLNKTDLRQLYREVMSKVQANMFVFLVFGSYAKRQQNKRSDIDILFVSNEKDFEVRASEILSLLPLKTHLLVFTEEEFKRMKDDKKPNVVQEAMKNHVILYGTECYYRLKNA
ncbi:MAG: nucleotidyltransferase domain-containing protein [Nanoarchaeota archaeon]